MHLFSITQWSSRLISRTRSGMRPRACRSPRTGRLPYFQYVIREKGKVELGTVSCGMCHTRVMPDGTVIKGAQGNFPFDRAAVFNAAQSLPPERIRLLQRSLFGAPWVKPDPQAGLDRALSQKLRNGMLRFRRESWRVREAASTTRRRFLTSSA